MRDSTIYTKEGIMERIREIRVIRELCLDRELHLTMLYSAVMDLNCPVDSLGKPFLPKKMREKKVKLEEVVLMKKT